MGVSVREAGKMKMKRDGDVIANIDGWELRTRPSAKACTWVSYKLMDAPGTRKTKTRSRVFYLAWNGQRLARSKEVKKLIEQEPQLAEKVTAFLESKGPAHAAV